MESVIDAIRSACLDFQQKPNCPRAAFFSGLIAKATDSLGAIHILQQTGSVWLLHSRWLLEALNIALALSKDARVIDQILREGAKTFLLISKRDSEMTRILPQISHKALASVEERFRDFERDCGAKERGLLYSCYRMLCEYTHFEFSRTAAYPNLGPEAPEILIQRQLLFMNLSTAAALSVVCLSNCPPDCGFPEPSFTAIDRLCSMAWSRVGESGV